MPIKDSSPDRAGTRKQAKARSEGSEQYRDLCSNCDRGDECESGTRPRRPIFFCENFEVFGAVPALTSDRSVREKPTKRPNGNRLIGLCVNCDNAGTCVSPKPEGGVWHCEEYR